MRCPFCGNIDTQVKDSRPAEDHVAIRRRRFCPACGGRFTTYERVQLRDLVVIKSSGTARGFRPRQARTLDPDRAPEAPGRA
jgi:transcriptional repressor NrdR